MERRNRRGRNTRRNKTALWRRCIAAAAAMMTVLTGFNYDGLENVFAEEKSGYQIDVSCSDDKTNAVLTGNTENVSTDTELTALTGKDGTEYDPDNFEMTVTENGTYTYTLEYSVNVAETGQTVEREETLEVTVDQIQTAQARTVETETEEEQGKTEPEAEQPEPEKQTATEEPADGSESKSGTQQPIEQTDGGSQNGAAADLPKKAPDTVPLSELEAELETMADESDSGDDELKEVTYGVYQYAFEEKGLSLTGDSTVPYTGGLFSENAPVYAESGITRNYKEAALVVVQDGIDDEVGIPITGLYPYSLQSGSGDMAWYYTTAENTEGSDNNYGTIQLGYKIPDEAQVRLYYQVPENPSYNITLKTNEVTSISVGEYKLKVKNVALSAINSSTKAVPTERVAVEFTKPTALEYMTVTITSEGGKKLAAFDTRKPEETGLKSETAETYSGSFKMENAPASIAIGGKIYGGGNRWFTAFSSMDVDSSMLGSLYPMSLGMSRTYALKIGDKTVSTPVYNDDNSGNVYYDIYGGTSVGGWRKPGYGLKNYSKGGEPYIHTFRISGSRTDAGASFQPVKTACAGDKSSTQDGSGTANVKVAQNTDSASFKAPVSNFAVGSAVKVRFETAIKNTDSSQPWNVIPNALAVDVYTEQGKFGTADFTRESFDLPRTEGKSVTYHLETGGTVTIECKTYNGNNVYKNPNENPIGHERRFQDGYMFSTIHIDDYGPSDILYAHNGAPNTFKGVVDMRWYAYEVTVQGVYHDFKLYQTTTSGAHKNAILNFDETAEDAVILDSDYENGIGTAENDTENNMVKDGLRSYTYLKMASTDAKGKFRTLEMPFTFRSFMKPGSGTNESYNNIILALAIRRGYSPPKVNQTSGSGVAIEDIGYSNGIYKYRIIMSGTDGSDLPSVITVSSKEVEFRAQFYDNGNKNDGKINYLGYGENHSRNYIIIPTDKVLESYPKLDHFEVWLVKTDGSTSKSGEMKIKTLDGKDEWHTGDIVNYDEVYNQASEQKFLEKDRDFYRLEIRPINNDAGNQSIDGKYVIKQQSAFSSGNTYQKDSFTDTVTGTVKALQGAEVVIVGYKDQIFDEASEKHFKLGLRSKTSGVLSKPGEEVAQLYYLSAVRASIDPESVEQLTGKKDVLDKIQEWNDKNADTLYTSVNNESHFVNYQDIYTYLEQNCTGFQGFKIKNAKTEEVYDYTLPQENGVNLYLIGAGSED